MTIPEFTPSPRAPLEEKVSAKPDEVLIKNLKLAINETWKAIKLGWEVIRNPIDPDWRKNQKYQHILNEMHMGFEDILMGGLTPSEKGVTYSEEDVLTPIRSWYEEIKEKDGVLLRRPHEPNKREECRFYVKKALQCLIDDNVPYRTQRDRYKAVISSCEKALATDWYKSLLRQGKTPEKMRELEQTVPEFAVLHAMALAQFTRINTQGFTESIAEELAKEGGYQEPAQAEEVQNGQKRLMGIFQANVAQMPAFTSAVDNASFVHKIAPTTEAFTGLGASNMYTRFYPIKDTGNPVYVKYRMKIGERDMTCVRTPTVTVGPHKVSPMFKAYLRALKSRGEKHTYINFQDRRLPHQHTGMRKAWQNMGFIREDLRAKTLERLNRDPEFKDVISVFTFDKDSPFYHQHVDRAAAYRFLYDLIDYGVALPQSAQEYQKRLSSHHTEAQVIDELMEIYNQNKAQLQLKPPPEGLLRGKAEFIDAFKGRIWDRQGSFHIPKEHKQDIEKIIDIVADTCFTDKTSLTPSDRQDLIEICYEFMADHLLRVTDANYFNETCKESADRGAGANYLKLSTKLLTEVLTQPDRKGLDLDLKHLVSKINEDSLTARKRGVNERLWRTLQAAKRMGSFADQHPEAFLRLVDKANASKDVHVYMHSKSEQKVKNFHQDYQQIKTAIRSLAKIRRAKAAIQNLAEKMTFTKAAEAA